MRILTDGDFVARLLPRRPADSHKGDYGRAFLLCGSVGYTGAARLAAEACVRAGAGLVSLGLPRTAYPVVAAACPPEVMCLPLPEDGDGRLSLAALPAVRGKIISADAALIGPGLGRSEELDRLVAALCEKSKAPLVLDADGLNALGGHIFIGRTAPVVLTPHEGEFRRLGGALEAYGREEAAGRMARARGAVVVLKGADTVTVAPDGRVYINTTGNPGMAKGGSGDVLAGIIGALLCQGLEPPEAAACGVCAHGMAGDLCASVMGEAGMLPTDLMDMLPKVWV